MATSNHTNSWLNIFNGDKWNIGLTNIPSLPTSDKDELKRFTTFVKNVTFPGYNIGIMEDKHHSHTIYHPQTSKINEGLPRLDVTWKLNEDLSNYFFMWSWLNNLRYGGKPSEQKEAMRDYVIDAFTIFLKDNQKRTTAQAKFTRLLLGDISPLTLVYGTTAEVTFTTTFVYEEFTCKSLINAIQSKV